MSLRERKKQRTRAAIVEAARTLFVERGYDATTIADIAEAADVSAGTVPGYFGTKADIFFADYDTVMAEFVDAVKRREQGTTAVRAAVAWRRARADADTGESAAARRWRKHARAIADANPVLMALERQRYAPAETAFAEEVARDLGDAPDDLRPKLVAALNIAMRLTWLRHVGVEDTASAVLGAYVDDCFLAAVDALVAVPVPPGQPGFFS